MTENVITDGISELLAAELAGDAPVYVVNPSRATIEELVAVLPETETGPVRLLAAERPLKDVMEEFIVASRAANLVDSGRLELRTTEDPDQNSLLVTDDGLTAIVGIDTKVAGLTTDDGSFLNDARSFYEDSWADAEAYTLRTPPLATVRETLAEDISEQTAADFDSVLTSLQTARGNGDGLDEVTISLLVAAKNGELLYDISKWGEDIGLASKATFSRTKTKLEDMGLIDTEKVPIDVGRPRLRLMLGDDRLKDADADQLASVAQSLLSN